MVRKKPLITKPLVTVVMPVYNAERFVAEAIESILNQTYKHIELIIIDDCSTDDSWKVILRYSQKKNIKLFRNKENRKLSHTLNLGLKQAKGEYIARMDADDWSYPDRIEKQATFLSEHLTVGIVGGTMEVVSATKKSLGMRKYPQEDSEIRKTMFWYSPYSHPLIMMRKSVLDQVGGYDDYYNPAEDYDLYFRIGMISEFANLPDILLKYRIVDKSMTTGSTKKMEMKTIEIRDKYADNPSYHMTIPQKIYNQLHKSSFIIPSSIKMKAFHMIRSTMK